MSDCPDCPDLALDPSTKRRKLRPTCCRDDYAAARARGEYPAGKPDDLRAEMDRRGGGNRRQRRAAKRKAKNARA